MPHIKTLAAAPAVLAAFSMTVSPAMAAQLPQPTVGEQAVRTIDPMLDATKADKLENHRYHRYRYRRGPDAGDVIAGVLIIGAIAAVADRASKRDRDRDYPDRDYRDRDYRDRGDYRDDHSWRDGRGIDRAVNMCIARVERDTRVETVDRVDRTARGWQIAGTIFNGDGFTCTIGDDGRVSDVDYGQRGARYDRDDGDRYEDADYDDGYAVAPEDDRQWEDDRYAAERDRLDQGAAADATDARPEYPGDDEIADEVDGDLDAEDGYTTI